MKKLQKKKGAYYNYPTNIIGTPLEPNGYVAGRGPTNVGIR